MTYTRYSIRFLLIAMASHVLVAQQQAWTWCFRMCGSDMHNTAGQIVYRQTDVGPFTQLITSWNGVRPAQGRFIFKVRARNQKTKTWTAWHTMYSWGVGAQQSFESTARDGTKYLHVRFEMPRSILADGFEIVVEPHAGACIDDIHAVAVCVSDMQIFEPESSQKLARTLSTVLVRGVPRYSQMVLEHDKAHVMCSPTSTSMLSSYIAEELFDPLRFAEYAYDHGMQAYGSWPFNTAHAYELCEGRAHIHVQRLHSFTELHALLQKHIPVVVSVRGALRGAPKVYPHGHLLVVVGYDAKNKKVLCHDPAMARKDRVRKAYPLDSFITAWERSHRLAYVAYPLHPGDQCYVASA